MRQNTHSAQPTPEVCGVTLKLASCVWSSCMDAGLSDMDSRNEAC